MAQKKIVQTAGRTQLGEFAPKFAELNPSLTLYGNFHKISAVFSF